MLGPQPRARWAQLILQDILAVRTSLATLEQRVRDVIADDGVGLAADAAALGFMPPAPPGRSVWDDDLAGDPPLFRDPPAKQAGSSVKGKQRAPTPPPPPPPGAPAGAAPDAEDEAKAKKRKRSQKPPAAKRPSTAKRASQSSSSSSAAAGEQSREKPGDGPPPADGLQRVMIQGRCKIEGCKYLRRRLFTKSGKYRYLQELCHHHIMRYRDGEDIGLKSPAFNYSMPSWVEFLLEATEPPPASKYGGRYMLVDFVDVDGEVEIEERLIEGDAHVTAESNDAGGEERVDSAVENNEGTDDREEEDEDDEDEDDDSGDDDDDNDNDDDIFATGAYVQTVGEPGIPPASAVFARDPHAI